MAKLRCDLHKQRIFALKGMFIHRGGWGNICKSPAASIGGVTYTAEQILDSGIALRKKDKKNES